MLRGPLGRDRCRSSDSSLFVERGAIKIVDIKGLINGINVRYRCCNAS